MLKKKAMCTMAREHREYNLKDLPLERMSCVGKNLEHMASSSSSLSSKHQAVVIALATLGASVTWRLCPRSL